MALPSLKNLILGKKYIGIEHFNSENEEKVSFILIEKKRNELVIVKKNYKIHSDSFYETLDKKLPFYLIINTNQVIQKEIFDIDSSDQKILHKAFPNISANDFYYEIWRLESKSIVAISRKTYVNEFINQYEKKGITIAGISLGVCSISEISKFTTNKQLKTNYQSISLNEEESILGKNESLSISEYEINGLNISNNYLLAFSGILRLLLNSNNTGNLIDLNHQLYDNYNQKSFFSKGIQIGTVIILSLLLINFFLFNNFYRKSQSAGETLSVNSATQITIKKVKERINIKEKQLLNTSRNTSGKSSAIINELVEKVPSSILLSELTFNPLSKKVKENEGIESIEKTVIISGTTLNNNDFTKWVENIEKLNFINKVVITNFGKNEALETTFALKLTLK
jgi:hypothetical protein